jgi:hypothetical protein
MKRAAVAFIALATFAGTLGAQTSIGVIAGEPTGLSVRQVLGTAASLDLAVAWSLVPRGESGAGGSLYLHVDYQQYFEQIDVEAVQLLFFVGVGPKIYLSDQPVVGARVPIGLFYNFPDLPLEAFLEIAPGLNLIPATELDVMGAIGLRYQL